METMKNLINQRTDLQQKEIDQHLDHQSVIRELRKIQQEIRQLAFQKRKEIKGSIPESYFYNPRVQEYLRAYQEQKGPYIIDEFCALDNETLRITGYTTPFFQRYHDNYDYVNLEKEIMYLKRLKRKGILTYQEQKLKTERYHIFPSTQDIHVSITDCQYNQYQVSLYQNQNETFIQSTVDNNYGYFYLANKIIPTDPDTLKDNFNEVCTWCSSHISYYPLEYYRYIQEQADQFDFFQEIEKRQKTK